MIEKQRLSSLKHKLGLLESRPFWKARNKAEPIFTEEFSSLPKVAFVTVQLNSAERYVFNSSYCTCSVTSSTTCLKLVDADLFPTSQTCETYSPCTKYHCTTTGSGLCQRVQRSVPVAGTTNLGGTNFVDCSYATKELAIPVD
ncbi:hypothetical protein Gasu2_03760 [Galdieria sulphuraria]|nr:hypothetical protein Gasu2_03760 [Galdieria sulphuraria]